MSDFENLDDRHQTVLQIKLDGFIEAAVQAARERHIGFSEALLLTMQALLREAATHSVGRQKLSELWVVALEKTYDDASEADVLTIH